MNPKLQKIIYLLIFLFAFIEKGNGQVLSTANLNLNSGGVINDVVYDPYHSCYIVVGKFDSIGGIARKNIAFLNASDLSVSNSPYLAPFTNIDGEIRCVAITSTFSANYTYYHLYIGGNFQTITTGAPQTRIGIAKFTGYKTNFLPIVSSNFSLQSWNADLDMTTLLTGYDAEGVDDILITNDTVIFSGRFFAVNDNSTYDLRDGIAAYTIDGSLLAYPSFASTGTYNTSRYFNIRKYGENLYCGGYVNGGGGYNGKLIKLTSTGSIMPGFTFNTSNLISVYNFYQFEDSLLIVVDDRNALGNQPDNLKIYRMSNGSEKINHAMSPQSGSIGGVANHSSLDVYKQYIFNSTMLPGYSVISYENPSGTIPVSTVDWNAAATYPLTGTYFSHVHVAGGHLFVSASNLATLSGSSKLKLGAYCLEPAKTKFFSVSDSTICPEQIVTYAIPNVEFADGFKWEYTGNGAFIIGQGPLSPVIEISSPSANNVQISFSATFTPGQLKVTPYSICNGVTKIYSNTITTNIISNPIPNINAGPDVALTCYNDTLVLSGYSDSAVISYEWLNAVPPHFQGTDTTVFQPGNYIFKVKNALGCPNFDTVIVSLDTIAPVAIPPAAPYDLTCAVPVKDFLGSSPTPNTTSEWYQGTNFFANPISVSTEGGYYFSVTDTLNGCKKDVGIYVEMDLVQPNITILDYPDFNITQPIDTLTCYQNSLNLTCSSDSANTTAIWTDVDTLTNLGDNINITTGGNYFILVTNNNNGCTNFMGVNVAVFQNLPDAFVPPNSFLNCSQDSLLLDGSSSLNNVNLEWNGGTISGPDPVTIYEAGVYYLTVTDTLNGCSVIDSVEIAQNNSINVFAGNDTLVCNQDLVNLNVNYSGTISGINYLWNSGSTLTNELFTAGNSAYAAVEVFGDNSCYGVDTVYLNLPPIPVINFDGFKPCGNEPSGQIVATPVSGIEPFQYSIDAGLNYQTSPVFSGLNFGIFPIWVKDSLLCDYEFEAVIDENSSLQEPEFLFSTYNFENDTVVIIDVSNPPTDSTVWEFSNDIIVLDNNALSPTILLPDTGVFQITMNAYYGDCLVEITKTIYSSAFDSLAATNYNQNGIKSIELFPNPTSGTFTVTVEFYKSQRAAMVVQDMVGYTYIYNEYDESIFISQDIILDTSVQNGTYILKIVSEFDSSTITFILAQ